MCEDTLMEIHGKEKIQAPNGFEFYLFEALPEEGPTQVLRLTGGVAPLKSRGPGKGQPNFRKLDPATRRTVFLPIEEHRTWVKDWEKKTGLCADCQGKGQRPAGWSIETGNRFKPCSTCGGSGKRASGRVV